jgi:hypothetical protein
MNEPRRLFELEEARDDLIKIIESDDQCIAVLRFGAVSLPAEMAGRLRELIGKKIAILRWTNGGYRIRDLTLEAENAA